MRQFFGKYRGKVAEDKDPSQLGRIQVEVPAVLGEGKKSWAMPCVPYAGPKVGFYAIPPKGANVWVEFEGGDPDYPIWTGCFWAKKEDVPTPFPSEKAAPDPKIKVFKTEGITLTMGNLGKGKAFAVEVTDPVVKKPLTLVMNADGIELNNNKKTIVKITGDTIELSNDKKIKATLTKNSIELVAQSLEAKLLSQGKKIEIKNGSSTVTLTTSNIEIKQSASSAKLSGSAIELKNGPGKVKVASSGVEASHSAAKVKLGPGTLQLSNGAGKVQVGPVSVNVNSGALEVI